MKAGVQWLYAQIRSDLSEHPFEAADGPGISVVSTGRRPLLRRLGVLCVLEIGGLCSPKMWPGPHFDTFGVWPVSLRLLDLGVLHARGDACDG